MLWHESTLLGLANWPVTAALHSDIPPVAQARCDKHWPILQNPGPSGRLVALRRWRRPRKTFLTAHRTSAQRQAGLPLTRGCPSECFAGPSCFSARSQTFVRRLDSTTAPPTISNPAISSEPNPGRLNRQLPQLDAPAVVCLLGRGGTSSLTV